jgi:hypothetical protein
LPAARVESGDREGAVRLAPFGGTRAAEGTLARVGPTTLKSIEPRVAPVDPTEARNRPSNNLVIDRPIILPTGGSL